MSITASKLAVITGASRGIGAAVARELSEKGFAVLLLARSAEGLNQVAGYLQAEGGTPYALPVDLTLEEDAEKVAETIDKINLDFKVLVHNAGIAKVSSIADMKIKDWRSIIDANLNAPFILTQKLLPRMKAGSQVIFINSIAGKEAFTDWSAYCASKHGLRALADTLRQEVAGSGIRVTSIYPAAVNTNIHEDLNLGWDRNQMMKPADVARAVSYCVTQGPNIRVNDIEIESMAGRF